MPTTIGPVNPGKPVEIDFVPLDTHVYAYRLWWRDPPSETWVEIGTGGTETGATNHFEHAVMVNSQLYCVVNVGTAQGQKKPDAYSAKFAIRQKGVLLGNAFVAGMTDALGVATNQDWVNFV